jgi:hypothetical protein
MTALRPLVFEANADGLFSSMRTRARAARRARTLEALTATMEKAKDYFDARSAAIESCIRAQESEYRLTQTRFAAAERADLERQSRGEELSAIQHRREMAAIRGGAERVEAEAALQAAQHALTAERGLGRDLAWDRRNVEVMDLAMAIAEREAVMRQHVSGPAQSDTASSGAGGADLLEEALYEARGQLRAHGLDTSRIDAVLERRRS